MLHDDPESIHLQPASIFGQLALEFLSPDFPSLLFHDSLTRIQKSLKTLNLHQKLNTIRK